MPLLAMGIPGSGATAIILHGVPAARHPARPQVFRAAPILFTPCSRR
ncbi:MAG: hypothetical protein KF786_00220 [Burkholderiaceae bacterium]|nr:hypothetical protein [Burkholderiaceae bacterium]